MEYTWISKGNYRNNMTLGDGGLVKVTQSCPALQVCKGYPASLLCLWVFAGKNTGVGCHSFSRESSQPRDWTQVSCIAGGFFTNWATREANMILKSMLFCINIYSRLTSTPGQINIHIKEKIPQFSHQGPTVSTGQYNWPKKGSFQKNCFKKSLWKVLKLI